MKPTKSKANKQKNETNSAWNIVKFKDERFPMCVRDTYCKDDPATGKAFITWPDYKDLVKVYSVMEKNIMPLTDWPQYQGTVIKDGMSKEFAFKLCIETKKTLLAKDVQIASATEGEAEQLSDSAQQIPKKRRPKPNVAYTPPAVKDKVKKGAKAVSIKAKSPIRLELPTVPGGQDGVPLDEPVIKKSRTKFGPTLDFPETHAKHNSPAGGRTISASRLVGTPPRFTSSLLSDFPSSVTRQLFTEKAASTSVASSPLEKTIGLNTRQEGNSPFQSRVFSASGKSPLKEKSTPLLYKKETRNKDRFMGIDLPMPDIVFQRYVITAFAEVKAMLKQHQGPAAGYGDDNEKEAFIQLPAKIQNMDLPIDSLAALQSFLGDLKNTKIVKKQLMAFLTGRIKKFVPSESSATGEQKIKELLNKCILPWMFTKQLVSKTNARTVSNMPGGKLFFESIADAITSASPTAVATTTVEAIIGLYFRKKGYEHRLKTKSVKVKKSATPGKKSPSKNSRSPRAASTSTAAAPYMAATPKRRTSPKKPWLQSATNESPRGSSHTASPKKVDLGRASTMLETVSAEDSEESSEEQATNLKPRPELKRKAKQTFFNVESDDEEGSVVGTPLRKKRTAAQPLDYEDEDSADEAFTNLVRQLTGE